MATEKTDLNLNQRTLGVFRNNCPRCRTEAVMHDGNDRRCFACGYYPDVERQHYDAQRRIVRETERVHREFVRSGRPKRGKGRKHETFG